MNYEDVLVPRIAFGSPCTRHAIRRGPAGRIEHDCLSFDFHAPAHRERPRIDEYIFLWRPLDEEWLAPAPEVLAEDPSRAGRQLESGGRDRIPSRVNRGDCDDPASPSAFDRSDLGKARGFDAPVTGQSDAEHQQERGWSIHMRGWPQGTRASVWAAGHGVTWDGSGGASPSRAVTSPSPCRD